MKDLVFKERPVKKLMERYEILYGRKDNVKECSEVKAIGLYENPSGSEY